MAQVVKKRCDPHKARFLAALLQAETRCHSTSHMTRSERVFEPGVQSAMKRQMSHCELPYAPQPLEAWQINQLDLVAPKLNEAVNGVPEVC